MMPGAFTGQLDAPAAVREPLFEVSMGGSSAGGPLGDLAGAVGLGGGEDPWQRSLESLNIDTGIAPFADHVILNLTNDEHAPTVAVGDEGSVRLGFSDSGVVDVFTGRVQSIRNGLDGVRQLEMSNAAGLLSSRRINQSYEQQGASDIIADLANRFGIDAQLAATDSELPFHVIDDRRNVYEHIAALTLDNRQLAFVRADGALQSTVFEPGDVVQEFRYGEDIIEICAHEFAPLVDCVEVVGEGAAGGQGAEAWNWLIKDPAPMTAKAGNGTYQRSRSDGSLRNAEAAQASASGRLMRSSARSQRTRISVSGAPAVGAGTTIKVVDAPMAELNGLGIVYRSRHVYDKQDGLISHLYIFKSTEDGFGNLAGALGGLL